MITKIERTVYTICSRAAAVCAVMLTAWAFLITAYIISRVFKLGWIFVEECTGYWLVLIAYIPLAYTLMTKTHIRIEVVFDRLPEKARSILLPCSDVIALVIASYLLGRSIEWVIYGIQYGTRSSAALNIILWPIYLLIPIGLTLFVFVFMVKIGRSVMELMPTRRRESRKKIEVG